MKIFNGVQAGLSNEVEYQGSVPGEAISIALVDNNPAAATTWLILVYCQIPQGRFFLGGFTTNTPAVDGAAARFVGFASCPGATGWLVRAINGFNPDDIGAELYVQAGKCCGGSANVPGVFQPPQPPGSGGDGGSGGFVPPVPPS